MAVLGKRKAQPEPSISPDEAAEIFRRHFEARFNPLPEATQKSGKQSRSEGQDEDEDDEDDVDSDNGLGGSGEESDDDDDGWGGVSEDEDDSDDEDDDEPKIVEVVDYSAAQTPKPLAMSKRELKAFMSSRPPDQSARLKDPSSTNKSSTTPSKTLPEDAPSLLAQDLELRRLIAESHLLAPSRAASSSSSFFRGGSNGSTNTTDADQPKTFAAGRIRQKATDLRIQALGSKTSILKQEKMPMHMRKGINAAAVSRESKRRREAKENGVILERETVGKKKGKKRDGGAGMGGGVDRPGVGRLRGAELRISESDVRKIEGTRDTFSRKRGRR